MLPFLLPIIPFLYLATLARTIVVGDPTEYTFVAHVLGIAHPPGYAFITLVGKLFQTLIPFGTIAWRMHLVSATAATIAALCVYGIVRQFGRNHLIALFTALLIATATNFWQHAIHANPHIITAAFLAFNLYALTKWAQDGSRYTVFGIRYLYLFCFSAGLGVTHHPLTVFALPACALFVLLVRPRILLEIKTLLTGTVFVLLGLLPWLYFPLRAPALVGTQFPSDMNTLDGFLNLALARGLRVNLFAFGLADQWDRLTVFWTLLRLQYTLPIIFLAIIGIGWLIFSKQWRFAILYGGAFLLNYIFVINTVQDVMAYLLGPFLIIGLLAGIGLHALIFNFEFSIPNFQFRTASLLFLIVFLFGPILQTVRNLPRVSLRNYSEGVDYVTAVHEQFDDTGEGAVLLNDWEHMTPLWYAEIVEGDVFDERDVRPIFVSAAKPWIKHLEEHLAGRPVYLSRFERSIFDAGYRLRPRGDLWQVGEPGDTSLPPELTPVTVGNGEIEIVGYQLLLENSANPTAYPDQLLRLNIAMRSPTGTNNIYAPVLHIGDDITLAFTTDSHLLSNSWLPNEIIVEQYEFVVPPAGDWRGGDAVLRLNNLSLDQDAGFQVDVGTIVYGDLPFARQRGNLLANFRQRAGLLKATANVGITQRRSAPFDEPLTVSNGDTIHIDLRWQVLESPEDSYTVFVHLIDLANRPIIDNLDYTPLGGATPSHLWFPKWLPGQQFTDPYRMEITNIPPGEYLIEVGLYEQFTRRRLHIYDANGNLNSDRYILGRVLVTE